MTMMTQAMDGERDIEKLSKLKQMIFWYDYKGASFVRQQDKKWKILFWTRYIEQ